MSSVTETRPDTTKASARRRAVVDLGAGLAPLSAFTLVTQWCLALPTIYTVETLGLYTLFSVVIIITLPDSLPKPGLGLANRVTLCRATLIMPLAVLALSSAPPDSRTAWWTIGISALAMVLDGIDGWISRRTACTTMFGARFDMELDAFLILILSVFVWRSGNTGGWVILIGALRYIFVASTQIWPVLNRNLPPSQRRKTVCAIQGLALLVCLGPIVSSTTATTVAATALILLIYSFCVDTWWLIRMTERNLSIR